MRWFTALNIKDTAAYGNVNARLIYLHLLCSMDYSTRLCPMTSRGIAAELGITHKAARVATEQLLAVGLIRAQAGAQARAQATIYKISDLGIGEGTSKGTSEGTQLTNNNIKFTLTHAREEFLRSERIEKIMEYLGCDFETAEWHSMRWLAMMAIRERTEWTDEKDAWQHLLSWIDKRKKEKRPTEPPRNWAKEVETVHQGPQKSVKVPEGWKEADWVQLCHIVSTPNHAPECDRVYQEALKTLSK